MSDALQRVVRFVEAQVPPPRPRRLAAGTDLRGALRLEWYDAEDLMVSFFEHFEVDRASFVFQAYFPVERFAIFRNPFRSPARPPPLTLGLLARAMELGRWSAHDEPASG